MNCLNIPGGIQDNKSIGMLPGQKQKTFPDPPMDAPVKLFKPILGSPAAIGQVALSGPLQANLRRTVQQKCSPGKKSAGNQGVHPIDQIKITVAGISLVYPG
jgi:hypothetical protein